MNEIRNNSELGIFIDLRSLEIYYYYLFRMYVKNHYKLRLKY